MTSTAGALVYTYIPQTRTPCGVGQQDGVLLTLVGLSLWDCPTPNHIYIVPQTFQFVNTFFCQVLYFSEKILGENLVVLSFPSLCTLIVSHFRGFVKGFFAFAGLFFLGVPYHPSWCPLWGLPLDIVIIPHPKAKRNSQSVQNGIKNFIYFCAIFPLDNCWTDVV